MTRAAAVTTLLLAAAATPGVADQPAPERAYVAVAPDGEWYLKMVPSPPGEVNPPPRVEVYQVLEAGPDRLAWTATGWYSHGAYLASGGELLVRLGTWSFAADPDDRLGIAFYRRDRLV